MGLVQEQRQCAAGFAPEPDRVEKEVVVAFDSESAMGGTDGAEDVESGGQVLEGIVDEVAGKHGEIGMEIVGGGHDPFQDLAAGESSDMEVADVGNRESIQCLWQLGELHNQIPDPEVFELEEAVSSSAEGREARKRACGEAEKLAARDGF